MPDITLCTNTLCHNAGHCYRARAEPKPFWQSMAMFEYTISDNGVECDYYWPMTNDDTERNDD